MIEEDYNPVLVYKPLGEKMVTNANIKEDDFLLGIATESQMDLLKMYGEKCVMVDSTHGTNQHGFHLTTLIVNDKDHEGLPVAIFFSSKLTSEHFEIFFRNILKKLPKFKTNFLMSDDTNTFINAWKRTFNDASRHVLCAWHVQRSIFRNLNSKVKNKDVSNKMKKDLKELIEELDPPTFEKYVEDFLSNYKDEDSFLNYFKTTYLNRKEKWAYCYRFNLGVNVNMKLERWHRSLKHEEGNGTVMKRLDKTLNIVLKACTKKLIG